MTSDQTHPTTPISDGDLRIAREAGYRNFAGRTDHEALDADLAAELEAAGITAHRLASIRSKGEVAGAVFGDLHGWGFRRAWRYWIADGPGIEVAAAEALHATHGRDVRVEGHCGCPSPREWFKGLAVGSYHVDTPSGLKALADTIRGLVEKNVVRASNPPPDTAVAGEFNRDQELLRRHQDYSISLGRIIEALCHGYDLPNGARELAPHHYKMAANYRAAAPPVPNRLRADADAELEELSAKATHRPEDLTIEYDNDGDFWEWWSVAGGKFSNEADAKYVHALVKAHRSARLAPASSGQGDADGWRDDPSADDRWNAGLDFGQTQLCAVLRVDPATVNWDAATETLDGDVQSVIRGILTAGLGEDWLEQRPLPAAPVEPGR